MEEKKLFTAFKKSVIHAVSLIIGLIITLPILWAQSISGLWFIVLLLVIIIVVDVLLLKLARKMGWV